MKRIEGIGWEAASKKTGNRFRKKLASVLSSFLFDACSGSSHLPLSSLDVPARKMKKKKTPILVVVGCLLDAAG